MPHPYCKTYEPENLARDACSKPGAEKLADAIRNHWRSLGFDVKPKVVEVGFSQTAHTVVYAVRSDMVNGLPKGMING